MTVIVFAGLHAIGNPVDILIGQDADQPTVPHHRPARAGPAAVAAIPAFVTGALHGNPGNSFVYSVPAVELILQRLPATFELAVAALLLAWCWACRSACSPGSIPSIRCRAC